MQSSNEVINQMLKQYHDKRLSHAFLLESNNQEKCLEDLKPFFKEINCLHQYRSDCNICNLCHLIDRLELPSLLIIRPDGQFIKKEQTLELKKLFQTKPIYSKYNIYVILNAECLNASSANTMLKFLEEPEDNILGIFIANSKENVIDTIKSRCQIFSNFYQENSDIKVSAKINELAVSFVKMYEENSLETIFYIRNNLMNDLVLKSDYVDFWQSLFLIYSHLYSVKLNLASLNEEYSTLQFILSRDSEYLLKQINYIEEMLLELQFNVNNELLLERFIFESR